MTLMLHFDAHQPISVILGRDVAEKVCKYYFSPSHFCVTALPSMANRHKFLLYPQWHVSSPGKCRWLWKVTTSCLPSCTQPCSPLVNGFVDDALRDSRPYVNEAIYKNLIVYKLKSVENLASQSIVIFETFAW